MRPITKILLLIVVAFVVYLLWPRSANMKAFDPAALSKLEVSTWQAQKQGKNFDALKLRFKVYTSQYNFDPISALRIAQSQAAALEELKLSRQESGDPTSENRAQQAFTEKFTWIKKQAQLTFDADAMAREEIAWRLLELDGAVPSEAAAPLSRIFAGLYGGDAKDFLEVATDLVTARALIFNDTPPADGSDPVVAAKEGAQEAYGLLKEIAAAPVAAPAAQ